MSLKAAFIFLDTEADSQTHRSVVSTPGIELTVVATANYADAEQVARRSSPMVSWPSSCAADSVPRGRRE